MTSHSRRQFLQVAGLTALGTASARAIEAFHRTGSPRLKLSVAAYSFRDYFKDATHKQTDGIERKLDIPGFIDFCADQGCGAELTAYYFPKDVTHEQLRTIQRHAFLRGVTVSGAAIGNNFTRPKGPELEKEIADTKHWIDNAVVLGAPHIRVFAGTQPKGAPLDDLKRSCIAAMEECCAYAGERGIFLGLENHGGGLVAGADEMLSLVQAVQSPWFGVSLDTGNFQTADPYADLVRCAPYAVNVQFKMEMKRAGAATSEPADLARVAQILRDANYQGWVALEYETADDPWQGVPAALAKLRPLFHG